MPAPSVQQDLVPKRIRNVTCLVLRGLHLHALRNAVGGRVLLHMAAVSMPSQ